MIVHLNTFVAMVNVFIVLTLQLFQGNTIIQMIHVPLHLSVMLTMIALRILFALVNNAGPNVINKVLLVLIMDGACSMPALT